MELTARNRETTFADLPQPSTGDNLSQVRGLLAQSNHSLVVLDDDPTGTQTVYDIPVLTEWTTSTLAEELKRSPDGFYILTNSRSLTAVEAQRLGREIGANLSAASAQTGQDIAVVSRSDSTLRGHFPDEVEALSDGLGEVFDGWILAPFFAEGGRFTLDDIHWVADEDDLIPAGQTPYARDEAFGYRHSHLPAWVEEKSQGRYRAENVITVSLERIRTGGPEAVFEHLLSAPSGSIIVVNAVTYTDMECFVAGLLQAEARGRRYLYRTAASFVRARLGLDARPLLSAENLQLSGGGALIVVGSYVPRSSAQLRALLSHAGVRAIELDVETVLGDGRDEAVVRTLTALTETLARNEDVVLYTSRKYQGAADATVSLQIGRRIAEALIEIVRRLSIRPGYLVAKGGITSSVLATEALGVRRAQVLGQVLPGVPVWELGAESRFPGLAYIVFPGNVGEESALLDLVTGLNPNR